MEEHVPGDSKTPEAVRIDLGDIFVGEGDPSSRAFAGTDLAPMDSMQTIRLFIFYGSGARQNPDRNNWAAEETYRVLGPWEKQQPENHNRGAILCTVDEETGDWIADKVGTDLHLPADNYDFFAVSPAVRMPNDNLGGTTPDRPSKVITHGGIADKFSPVMRLRPITVYTTARQNFNIGSGEEEVGSGNNGIFTVYPKPFTLLTSKISFRLHKGSDVDSMKIDNRGILMEGLPLQPYRVNFVLGDSLLQPMQVKTPDVDYVSGSASIAGHNDVTEHPGIPNAAPGDPTYEGEVSYYFETEIVPSMIKVPASEAIDEVYYAGPVKITFYLYINPTDENPDGNYKAYTYTINGKYFQKGRHYHYDVKVSAAGIFVKGWSDKTWQTTIPK